MSADNGIYILQTKERYGNQYRVVYANAIDNLGWSYENGRESTYNLVPTRVIEYFGGSKYTRDQNVAFRIAGRELKSCPYVEYGIQLIKTDKSWRQIVCEAKELAVKELKVLQEKSEFNDNYQYDIEQLENALKTVESKWGDL